MKDLGWETLSTNSNIWSAYKVEKTGTTGETIRGYNDDEIGDNSEKEHIYSEVKINNFNIKQEGEGLRTETNPEIKKMFLNNTYFRYDGTAKTAEIITALRKKILEELHSEYGLASDKEGIKYGPLNEYYAYYFSGSGVKVTDVTNRHYKASELGLPINEEEGDKEYNVKDYSGQVSLNQDSLNAFAMLEGIHTLDADYIYRDFKELIVELGYFTKSELTDEIPELLAFPIPNTGSFRFPDRSIDKRENEYGTMIHSRGDIYANQKLEDQIKESEGYTDEEKNFNSTGGTETRFRQILTDETGRRGLDEEIDFSTLGTDSGNTGGINIDQNVLSGVAENLGASSNTSGNKTHSVTNILGETITFKNIISCKNPITVPSRVTLDHYIETCYEMCNYMNEIGYDYCVVTDCENDGCDLDCSVCHGECPDPENCEEPGCCCTKIQCKHNVWYNYHETDENRKVTKHGLCSSFFKSLKGDSSKGVQYTRNVCCTVLVKWTLQNVGILGENQSPTKALYEEWGAERIEYGEPLRRGDIIMYSHHTDVYGGLLEDGRPFKFNGGHPVQKNSEAGTGASSINAFDPDENGWPKPDSLNTPEYAIRLPWLEYEESMYEGYDGNEEVVSPVTGILLEYGTYNSDSSKEDIDSITGEKYRVNTDLKYGSLSNINNNEDYESEDSEDSSNTKGQIVSDSVGYAKILVLDTEYYKNLEQSTNSRWKDDSLINEYGKYRDVLIDDKDSLADDKLNGDDSVRWKELDQTIYGYKEFAERYEAAGIAGYIVLIDGFICEAPDSQISRGIGAAQKIPYGDDSTGERRKENTYHVDGDINEGISFKLVTEDNFEDEQLKASYVEPKEYKLASQKATNKLIAENQVMSEASSTLYLESGKSFNGEELVYIKEGTVIGRTMTDKEIVMTDEEFAASGREIRIREQDTGTYEDNRLFTTGTDIEARDKVIGNYIRVIMRDLDTTPVEDVEDYMKLDKIDEIPDEVLFMAGVITAEAGGKLDSKTKTIRWNFDGAVACALTIKNRLNSSSYPNTLSELLTKEEEYSSVRKDPSKCTGWIYYGQVISLEVDGEKYYVSKPTESAIAIAQKIYEGKDTAAYKKVREIVENRDSWKCFTTGGGGLSDTVRVPKTETTYSNYYGNK